MTKKATPEILEKISGIVDEMSIDELRKFVSIEDSLVQAKEDFPLMFYKPNCIQDPFHNSTAVRRLLYGGNMTGKSMGGAKEACCNILGYDPSGTTTKKYPKPPTYGWAGATNMEKAQSINKVEILNLLPRGFMESFNKETYTMTFKNGSQATLKSYESPIETWTGMALNWLWLDEECPYLYYLEGQSRVNRRSGSIWITMTPLYSNSKWMFTELVKKAPFFKHIDVFKANLRDNCFLTEAQIEQQELDNKGKHDEKARLYGDFLSQEGRIFYGYNSVYQYVRAEPVLEMLRRDREQKYPLFKYMLCIDAHPRSPDVCTWAAFNEDLPLIYFIAEMRMEDMHAADFAERVLVRSSDFGEMEYQILDTGESIKDTELGTSIRTTMSDAGLDTETPRKNYIESRDRILDYSKVGAMFILDTCPNLNEAIDLALWDEYKGNRKYEDAPKEKPKTSPLTHHSDTCRYMMMLMPNIVGLTKGGLVGQRFPTHGGHSLLRKRF